MISFANLEVEILVWPAAVLFILVLLPIPFLSTQIANLIAKIESYRIAGVSPLVAAWLMGGTFFAFSLYDLNNRFSEEHKVDAVLTDKHAFRHPNETKDDFLRRKWLAERNLYIHVMVFILYAALQKIARLVLEKKRLENVVRAQELERKKL